VVEPAQAPTVFAEAVQVLKGQPSDQELLQAWADLDAACVARFQPAWDFMHAEFKNPELIEGKIPQYPKEALPTGTFAIAVVKCRLGVDGRLRACEVLEQAPYGVTEALLEVIPTRRYRPVTLAGHPVEVPYTLHARMGIHGVKLTPEEELGWARRRTEGFPKSPHAWWELAQQLARRRRMTPGTFVPCST
jgi:hypothetical protein